MTIPSRSRTLRDPAALLHALELHQLELEVQNHELIATNAELHRSNVALGVALERFRALYQLAPVAYVTIDPARAIVDLNRAAETLLAAPRAQLLGHDLERFIADADRPRFRACLDVAFGAGCARCADVAVVRPGDGPVDAMIEGVVLRETATDQVQCVLALVDLTARKLAERARRRAQDEVLAIVSHDLRGPLNAIDLACDALGSELPPDEHARCVAAIARSSARCERLIKDLLNVALIESGRLLLDLALLDARELVRHVAADHELAAAAAGSRLTVAVGPTPLLVHGDRDRLHQVLSNLIGNALIHARGTAIAVSAEASVDVAVLTVSDDGPGIPPDELPRVFERYRQGARRRGGAGLGLAIVKGLVEAHHGVATVTSQLGRGTRFEVRLPLSETRA